MLHETSIFGRFENVFHLWQTKPHISFGDGVSSFGWGGGGGGPSVLKFEQRGVQIHYVGDFSFIGMVLCAYLFSLFSL